MLNDFIPVIRKLSSKDHPDGITIVPLADAHYGSEEFNSVKWHKAIQRIYDDPHCFCVLVGDLLDFATPTSPTSVFEQTCSPRVQKAWLADELRPIANKVLGAVGGNHDTQRAARAVDQDPMYDVMVQLGIDGVYRQNICFLQVRFTYDLKGYAKTRQFFSFAITHGAGGGMYIGSSANKVQRYAEVCEGVDCIITGHTHKPMTFPGSKLVFDPNAKTVKTRQFNVVVASSFLDYGGYPVRKLMTPVAHVLTEIRLNYNQNGWKELRVLQ